MNELSQQEIDLSEDQKEALQELVNIGMGLAGDSLARILKTFVELSIPRISLIKVDELNQEVSRLVGDKALVTAVRQAFFSLARRSHYCLRSKWLQRISFTDGLLRRPR